MKPRPCVTGTRPWTAPAPAPFWRKPWLPLLLAALLLGGCTASLIKPDQEVRVHTLGLRSPVAWTQFGEGRSRSWTLDGPALNRLQVIDGVKDGEHVFLHRRTQRMRKGEGALYRAGMTDPEIVDLLADGLATQGAENVQILEVRPFRFAAVQGFAADFRFQNEAGLHYRATLAGAADGSTLSYLLFYAPQQYFFERDLEAVQAVFQSARRVR